MASTLQPNQSNHHVKMIQSRWEMGEMGVPKVIGTVSVSINVLLPNTKTAPAVSPIGAAVTNPQILFWCFYS